MVAWCWQRAEAGAWEQHGHDGLSRRGDAGLSLDVVRFYFMDARVAAAFRGRWEHGNGEVKVSNVRVGERRCDWPVLQRTHCD
jgi:hypothetical protein